MGKEIRFIDGPLIGLETTIRDSRSDRFLWYDEDDDGTCWANVYSPVEGEPGVWRLLNRKEAPNLELTPDELYEMLD